jgi:hypothetical protein
MRSPQLARCSRDQLRRRMGQHGAALARGRGGECEVFRAPPSLGRQLEARQRASRTQSRVREWSTHYSPRAHDPLTRRLRRAVVVWPEEPGLTPAPTLLRRRHLLLHGHRAASPAGAASPRRRHAQRRHARRRLRGATCAAPPAPSLRSAACAALPLPRRLIAATPAPQRLTPRRRARRRLARLHLAPRCLAREAVSPPRAAFPCEDITI